MAKTKRTEQPKIAVREEGFFSLIDEYSRMKCDFAELVNLIYPVVELAETNPYMNKELWRRHILGISKELHKLIDEHERGDALVSKETTEFIEGWRDRNKATAV